MQFKYSKLVCCKVYLFTVEYYQYMKKEVLFFLKANTKFQMSTLY